MHHSTMDGVAGMSTLGVMYDLTAEGEPPQRRPAMRAPADPADFLELTSTAVADFLRQGVRTVGRCQAWSARSSRRRRA